MQLIYKFIYNRHVNYILRNINFSLRHILKKIKIPPSGLQSLKTKAGTIKIATNQTSYLTQLLFWNGYEQFEYSEIFEDLSKSIDVFFDIGSNIGYYSLLAAKSNSRIRIVAFEPAIGPKYFLNKNIKLNGCSNQIIAIDVALSNIEGEIDFYEVQNSKYKYLKHNLAGEGNAGTKKTSRNFIRNTVKSSTLENIVNTLHINKIDLIKIDTEGTEIDILESGLSVIERFQPIVICETLFNTIELKLENYFKKMGYELYNHSDKGLIKVSTIVRSKDDGIRNCFFVPKSKTNLISKFVQNGTM